MLVLLDVSAAIIGLAFIAVGLLSIARRRVSLQGKAIHHAPAVMLGIGLVGCGIVLLAFFPMLFHPQLSYSWLLRPGLTISFYLIGISLFWSGCQNRQWSLFGWALLLILLAAGVLIPPTTLAAAVYHLTGDKRFKAPDYGR